MNRISEQYQVVVCGEGLAGFCAAVAPARKGIKICILQNRPVFGGNSSSEVQVYEQKDNHQTLNKITFDPPLQTKRLVVEPKHPSEHVPAAVFEVLVY